MEKVEIEISSIEELVELVSNIPDGVLLDIDLDMEDEDGEE